jgi:hypothetical protein
MQSTDQLAHAIGHALDAIVISAQHVPDDVAKKQIMQLVEAAAACARNAAYQSQHEARSFAGIVPTQR